MPFTLPATDIREPRVGEKMLGESDSRFRRIFDGVRDAILVVKPDGVVLEANAGACDLLGLSREQLLATTFSELVPGEPFKSLAHRQPGSKASKVPIEAVCARSNGERIPIEITASHQSVAGESASFVVMRDISDRKQSDEVLRESEERFRAVAETAVDAILIADDAGNIRYCNSAAERIFGYKKSEILGKSTSLLIADRDLNGYQEGMKRWRRTGKSPTLGKRMESYGLRKDGEQFPLVISLASWKAAGGHYFSAIIRDLSESKKVEHRAQLQDRLAAVGQLAAGVAHDFNNILGTIILYSELLRDEVELSQRSRERLATVLQQAQRGADLVSQVLDFSRRSVMERRPVDLAPFLKEMRKMLSRTLSESIQLKLLLHGEGFLVRADLTRMQQAVMNLALNARDAMPEGGELAFELAKLEVRQGEPPPYRDMAPGPWVRLRIGDTGTGIPLDVLPHIFEPFFTTKPVGSGTGLGLAQVYGIVKQHDGYIEARSEQDVGTDIIIYLPTLVAEAPPVPMPKTAELAGGGGETILVVEDDGPARQAICETLETLNYRVFRAANGIEAMSLLERHSGKIALVLSDMVMPDMGGRELLEALEQTDHGPIVVIMTGYPLGTGTSELLDRRQVVWLQKPISSELLAQTVHEALAREE